MKAGVPKNPSKRSVRLEWTGKWFLRKNPERSHMTEISSRRFPERYTVVFPSQVDDTEIRITLSGALNDRVDPELLETIKQWTLGKRSGRRLEPIDTL
jgi:hypothetical protein